MRKLSVFNFTTVNGFCEGPGGDISWNIHDTEETDHAKTGLQADNILLFGRKTWQMMAGFWPTPMAMEQMPEVAAGMNRAEKIVFSNTLKDANWNNSRIIGGDIGKVIRELKATPGKDLTILGSGSIVTHFTDLGLIDAWQIMINPVALGKGTPMFHGIKSKLNLKLVNSSIKKNGLVVLDYIPA
ncbi:dihydrofolate reductase family protein [Pseudobacter ginsenosidimutans]|uniref:Dihydrofolate reductase n=1 Tax=Pseudobacter ginsenosidimutans TaxID=661488 RepID=A0A4Q7MDJ6_9BACT|nr:dihydrofolate reductase family protein [Pseudobacter ginsenosidimutans]QEC42801.1 dihydrofolate reductase [Pseudobacter ginsenosidimutans]RZS65038.1 dihydrofolate reductase [Pseudobacter ginsenosidimutans]